MSYCIIFVFLWIFNLYSRDTLKDLALVFAQQFDDQNQKREIIELLEGWQADTVQVKKVSSAINQNRDLLKTFEKDFSL